MTLINTVGCPAAGKSTILSRFILEHPKWKYCTIDEYRIEYQNEDRAWHELTKQVLSNKDCVIESCGIGWRLGQLLNLPKIRRRHLITIEFWGSRDILLERLKERHKRPLPPPFRREDELLALDYTLENLHKEIEGHIDYSIKTTNKSIEEVYQEVNKLIQREVLLTKDSKVFRKSNYPEQVPSGNRQFQRMKGL